MYGLPEGTLTVFCDCILMFEQQEDAGTSTRLVEAGVQLRPCTST